MNTPVETLIASAEAARDRGALAEGTQAARAAWEAATGDDQRRRAGLLLAHFHYRSGALVEMVEHGLRLLPLARAGGSEAELFDLLRMVSLGGSDTGRLDTAFACAQEAHALALHIGDRGRIALAVNALACSFERMGDPWQSERLMLEALTIARAQGERHPIFVTLNNLVAVLIGMYHLLRDAVPLHEAREPLRRALPFARETLRIAEEGAEPFYRIFAAGNLGETLLHLGDLDAARDVLQHNADLARQIGAATQAWRIDCTLGELALFEGRADDAWQLLVAVLSASGGTEAPATRMRLHHALWKAASARQRPADALHHLEQFLALERQRAVLQLRAQSQLLVTRSEIERAQAESRRDQLTQLANRREVERRWPLLLDAARTAGTPLAVAMLDLDHFKQINDRFGHAIGDAVLVALAELLRDNTRSADMVARVGGEEFLLVLTDASAARALDICERLRQRVAAHDWQAVAPQLAVTLSVGLTSSPPLDADTLTARADAALYRAKAEGRNRVVVG